MEVFMDPFLEGEGTVIVTPVSNLKRKLHSILVEFHTYRITSSCWDCVEDGGVFACPGHRPEIEKVNRFRSDEEIKKFLGKADPWKLL